MLERTLSSPHLPVRPKVSNVMRDVLLALLPGIAIYTAFFGIGVLVNLVLCALACWGFEALFLKLRSRPLRPFLSDGTALVTGALLALALPPYAPWWVAVLAAGFAMSLGKHLYGGLGYNPFNPAMVGYIVMLISFPEAMTRWPDPQPLWTDSAGLGQQLAAIGGARIDALVGATPLDHIRTQLLLNNTLGEIQEHRVFGLLAGQGWEWISLGWLLGGLWLIRRGHISWRIPAGLLGALALMAAVFWLIDADRYASPLFHLLSGGAILGAFFIATDPVSASTTPLGRILFGAGIGLLTYVIRAWGGYPDAIAFAVLLMNIGVPLLDQYTKPRVYGQKQREESL